MTKSDLIYGVNNVSLEELLPISRVKTDEDILRYRSEGYNLYCTLKRWQELYPNINYEFVYYTKSIAGGTIYFDRDKLIYLEMPIYGEKSLAPYGNIDETVQMSIDRIQGSVSSKDYKLYSFMLHDSVRVQMLKLLVEHEDPCPELYSVFLQGYCSSDYNTGVLDDTLISKLEKCKSEEQRSRTVELLNAYPDRITVYRGEASKSISYERAYSWTTDIDIAYFFMGWKGAKGQRLITAEVNKQDVFEVMDYIEYENEVLVSPKSLDNIRVKEVKSIDYMLSARFGYGEVCNHLYKEIACNQNLFHDHLQDHTLAHSVRVLLLCTFIADYEDVTRDDASRLLTAATYHDCGRDNDDVDPSHGMESYKRFVSLKKHDPWIEFLITQHCIPDETAKNKLGSITGVSEEDKKRLWHLYVILKDADALDRVRFGYGPDALKSSLLRLSSSRELIGVAYALMHYKVQCMN